MKIGLDYHGVITKYPKIIGRLASILFLAGGNEIHIITGHSLPPEFKDRLSKIFPMMIVHKIYSLTDELEARGFPFTINDKGGKMFDKEVWNKEKSIYCENNGIDIMIDDSPVYGQYFKKTIYLQVK